jgi:hypothetical protein
MSYSKPGDGGSQTAIMRAQFDADSHSLTIRKIFMWASVF